MIVWFPEAWVRQFSDPRLALEPFGIADTIFVGMRDTAEVLGTLAPCPVHHLPPAVDVTRFSADRGPVDPRPIDVLGIGRREPKLHRPWSIGRTRPRSSTSTTRLAAPRCATSTPIAGTSATPTAAPTSPSPTTPSTMRPRSSATSGRCRAALGGAGQRCADGGPRTGRSSAAGADRRMRGRGPSPGPGGGGRGHRATPRGDRAAQRLHNARLALLGHDWAHRWQRMFALAGVPASRGIDDRIERLANQANELT